MSRRQAIFWTRTKAVQKNCRLKRHNVTIVQFRYCECKLTPDFMHHITTDLHLAVWSRLVHINTTCSFADLYVCAWRDCPAECMSTRHAHVLTCMYALGGMVPLTADQHSMLICQLSCYHLLDGSAYSRSLWRAHLMYRMFALCGLVPL